MKTKKHQDPLYHDDKVNETGFLPGAQKIILFALLMLVLFNSRLSFAQCCPQTVLTVNTGYNPATGWPVPAGSTDPRWRVNFNTTAVCNVCPGGFLPIGFTPVAPPGPARVITPGGSGATSAFSNALSCVNSNFYTTDNVGPTGHLYYTDFIREFNLCVPSAVTINLGISCDNGVDVYFNPVGVPAYAPGGGGSLFNLPVGAGFNGGNWSSFNSCSFTTGTLAAGTTHRIYIRAYNYNHPASDGIATNHFYLNVLGTVTSAVPLAITSEATGCTPGTTLCAAPVITGTLTACVGQNRTLVGTPAGGTWNSTSWWIAPINPATGVYSGNLPGTSVITYTDPCGRTTTRTVTINPLPTPITGTLTLCSGGATTTLGSTPPGGTWSSTPTSVATIGAFTGVVTSGMAGTAAISYTLPTGCRSTAVVTVNQTPTIGTDHDMCLFDPAVTLTASLPGGTWNSSASGIATIVGTGPVTGAVTSVSAGTTTISYTSAAGCSGLFTFTVHPLPTINPIPAVCATSTVTATASPAGGSWTSSPGTGSVTIGGTSGIITGVLAGTANVTYTSPAGCVSTATVTVLAQPSFTPSYTISPLCQGDPLNLFWNTPIPSAPIPGYTYSWSGPWGFSSTLANPTRGAATLPMSGTYSVTVTNTLGCSKTMTLNVSVNPLPTPTIVCPPSLCVGHTAVITASPGIPPGSSISGFSWTSTPGVTILSSTSTSATVRGDAPGMVIITYQVISAAGCIGYAYCEFEVLPSPEPITGNMLLCGLQQFTTLSSATPGGAWGSTNPLMPINPLTGVIWALGYGTSTITYTMPNGCFVSAIFTVGVEPAPFFVQCGRDMCVDDIITIYADPGYTAGAYTTSWSGTPLGLATITPLLPLPSTSATVHAHSPGVLTITFEVITAEGCKGYAYCTITIHPKPDPITGNLLICGLNQTTVLSSATPGGTWSSTNPSIPISPTGVVTGLGYGTTTISYTMPTGCFVTVVVTVDAVPTPEFIQCGREICVGETITVWVNPGYAGTFTSSWPTPSGTGSVTVTPILPLPSTSATVTGVSAGVVTLTYEVITAAGCKGYAYCEITVLPTPDAISGPSVLCEDDVITLTNPTPGGSWSSSHPTIASVVIDPGTGNGIVTGVAAGTAVITYSLGKCFVTHTITVNPNPTPFFIQCASHVCEGSSYTVHVDPTYHLLGWPVLWSSTPLGIITTLPAGPTSVVVTGWSAGVATLSYTVTDPLTGCKGYALCTITVNPTPAPITGPTSLCEGDVMTLSTISTGGIWISDNPSVATVDPMGVVTGVAAGTATIDYILGSGPTACASSLTVTVNPNPTPFFIQCASHVCEGSSYTVYVDPAYHLLGWTTSWSFTPPGIISTSPAGPTSIVVHGVLAGVATLSYTVTDPLTGCKGHALCTITVNPTPAPVTSFTTTVCEGSTVTYSTTSTGGTWYSDNPSVATVDAFGVVTGVSGGTANIDYVLGSGPTACASSLMITVIPMATACITYGSDISSNLFFLFNPTVGGVPITSGATITFEAYDCFGAIIPLGALGTMTGPYPYRIDYWSFPSGGAGICSLCVTSITYMGCTWPVTTCCIPWPSAKPGRTAPDMPAEALAASISVVPNPTKGTFTLKGSLSNTTISGDVAVELTDMLGKTVYTTAMAIEKGVFDKTITIDNSLANGMYMIRIKGKGVNENVKLNLHR